MNISPITTIETPFKEKFGVPRQSLLVKEAWGKMVFPKNDFYMEAFRGIEDCHYLWLLFHFHLISNQKFNGLIRPPRFENKIKKGVFATRSPHRPNKIGLSLVKFEKLHVLTSDILLEVSGVDLVDQTPILDIKPYVPYSDQKEVHNLYQVPPSEKKVIWRCEKFGEDKLIEKVVALDPRPSHEKSLNSQKEYGMSLGGLNVRFLFKDDHFEIILVEAIKQFD